MIAWISLILLGLVEASFFGEKSRVRELSARNFRDRVLYDGNLTAVVFYAPWCGHCKQLAPEWNTLAKELYGIANVAAVNCDLDANKGLCSKFKVQGFPTIKVFQPAKLSDIDFKDAVEGKSLPRRRPKIYDYNGPRGVQELKNFIVPKLRNYVASLHNDDALLWMAPNKIPRILFLPGNNYKSVQVPPLLKILSREYFGKMRFATMPRRVDGAWNLLSMKAVDESHLIYMSDDKPPVVYKGSMKKQKVKKFLDEQYGLEFSRRKHLKQDLIPSRDKAANGLEFVVEDAQKEKLEHVVENEKLLELEKESAKEARKAAFSRAGKEYIENEDESTQTDQEKSSTEKVLVPLPSDIQNIEEGGVEAEDFEYEGPEGSDVAEEDKNEPELDVAEEVVELDSAITEVSEEHLVQEGPEALAAFIAEQNADKVQDNQAEGEVNSASKTGPAPARVTKSSNESRIKEYDTFAFKCLRAGYNCAVMVTTNETQKSDLLTIMRSIQNISPEVKRRTVYEWIIRGESDELDEFLAEIGLEGSPALLWHDFKKQKMHFYDKDWSTRQLQAYFEDLNARKIEPDRVLPGKYKYWYTKEEVEAQLKKQKEEEERLIKEEL